MDTTTNRRLDLGGATTLPTTEHTLRESFALTGCSAQNHGQYIRDNHRMLERILRTSRLAACRKWILRRDSFSTSLTYVATTIRELPTDVVVRAERGIQQTCYPLFPESDWLLRGTCAGWTDLSEGNDQTAHLCSGRGNLRTESGWADSDQCRQVWWPSLEAYPTTGQ